MKRLLFENEKIIIDSYHIVLSGLFFWLFRNYGGKGYFYCWCGLAFDVSVSFLGRTPLGVRPFSGKSRYFRWFWRKICSKDVFYTL
jgi:hypothetical protein